MNVISNYIFLNNIKYKLKILLNLITKIMDGEFENVIFQLFLKKLKISYIVKSYYNLWKNIYENRYF